MSRFLLAALALGAASITFARVPPSHLPTESAQQTLPTEVFAELPQAEDPVVSPNGRYLVARVAHAGQLLLGLVSLEGNVPPLFMHPDNADLNWWRWVNDDWIIVGIGREERVRNDLYYSTRVVAIHVATRKMSVLVDHEAGRYADDVIWTARDSSARILLSYEPNYLGPSRKVVQIDLATGKRKVVQEPREGVFEWFADSDGVVRAGIGWSPDGRSSRLIYRENASSGFKTVDRARGLGERLTIPVAFPRDASKGLVIEDDPEGFSALYEFNLATFQRGRQLYNTPGYDITGVIADPSGNGYLGVLVEEQWPTTHWNDPSLAALQTKLSARVKGARVEITSMSRDRKTGVVRLSGADSPGAWMVYRNGGEELLPIANGNSVIGLNRLHPVQTFRYRARDGVEIAAILTLPKHKPGVLPMIVMPHGGPRARDSEVWDWWAQFLADRGYAVVQPNYRGSTGYGTRFMELGEGQWGLAMQDDLDDAVKALAGQGIIDPKRVCMVGASYGGYAAMRAAQRDGDKYRCAISYAGVSDLNRMLRHERKFLHGGARGDWLREQAPDLKSVSPLNFPEQFSIPVLLVHGDKDTVVPPVHSRLLAERLKRAGKDVTYIRQREADHHFSRGADRLEFLKAMEAFLTKHNPA